MAIQNKLKLQQDFSNNKLYRVFTLYLPLFIVLFALNGPSFACIKDTDCDTGETCFKRERRASGICYPSLNNKSSDNSEEIDLKPITGEKRDRAVQWLGDPMEIIRDNLPNRTIGNVCVVTGDCPDGSECVLAGFEGRCVEF